RPAFREANHARDRAGERGRSLELAPADENARRAEARRSQRTAPALGWLLVDTLIDPRDLVDPAAPFEMRHRKQLLGVPVEVVRDVGYLLVELLQGVAHDSPGSPSSTSNRAEHCGHTTACFDSPLALMWL